MWFWPLITIFLFYFFALLQNSFFVHFALFGALPNLIFAMYFLFIFFGKKEKNWQVIFFAITAGLFSDFFSSAYFGSSIILLLIIGFLLKKIQSSLKEDKDKYPVVYFIPLFLLSFISYDLLSQVVVHFFSASALSFNVGFVFFARLLYTLFFAILGFYIFKKMLKINLLSI